MSKGGPYNPLDKVNLAKSIELELLVRPLGPLGESEAASGAGIYVIYYDGSFPAYQPLTRAANNGEFDRPIYVGKAIPKGGRKGGLTKDSSSGRALAERLGQHAKSIEESKNLELGDFFVRHLVVDDIWIPLGENMLIETFKPVWNQVIDGFGNKDPGKRRADQYESPWDVLHPGRQFTEKLTRRPIPPELLVQRVDDFFAGRPLTKLPKLPKLKGGVEEDGDEFLDDE